MHYGTLPSFIVFIQIVFHVTFPIITVLTKTTFSTRSSFVSHTCNSLNHILSCIHNGVVPTPRLAQVTEWSRQERHSTATHRRTPLEHQALLLSLPPRRGIVNVPWVCADIKMQMWDVVTPCSFLHFSSTCPIWHRWKFSMYCCTGCTQIPLTTWD